MKKKETKLTLCLIFLIALFIIVNIIIDKSMKESRDTFIGSNEHLLTNNYVDLFDKYPNQSFKLSFDAFSQKEGNVIIYLLEPGQNSSSKYFLQEIVHFTENTEHYELTITPKLENPKMIDAYLSFYGTYGSGVIPTISHIKVEPIIQ